MLSVKDRAIHIKEVITELEPWIQMAENEIEPDKVAKAGIEIRKLLRECVSVARSIRGIEQESEAA